MTARPLATRAATTAGRDVLRSGAMHSGRRSKRLHPVLHAGLMVAALSACAALAYLAARLEEIDRASAPGIRIPITKP